MRVHRETYLPEGPALGRLLVASQCLSSTQVALRTSRGATGDSHERLVFWLGRTIGTTTIVLASATPETISGPGQVYVLEKQVNAIARNARECGLGIVAQVHSHPGTDTRHSDGDDQLVFMPFHGMFSLVIADYGQGSLLPEKGAGLHQYQNDHWTRIIDPAAMTVIPGYLMSNRS